MNINQRYYDYSTFHTEEATKQCVLFSIQKAGRIGRTERELARENYNFDRYGQRDRQKLLQAIEQEHQVHLVYVPNESGSKRGRKRFAWVAERCLEECLA